MHLFVLLFGDSIRNGAKFKEVYLQLNNNIISQLVKMRGIISHIIKYQIVFIDKMIISIQLILQLHR